MVLVYSVAILEPAVGRVTALLRDKLLDLNYNTPIVLTRSGCLTEFAETYDLFLVAAPGMMGEPSPTLRCNALLVPWETPAESVARIPSDWVVSYGMGVRDSITVSSLAPDYAQLALQRELVTLGGVVLEQQEIPIQLPPDTGHSAAMALYGALLMLGVPPEALTTTQDI